ncbi:hypothetical protein MAPG_03892 [Magnaporthiopsis poae ATCC 64411]|uniref:DNA-directed RNA polymerase RBP11-like dimerisation domain-containing protein n=1 Tax=Magnaporthiopsis poae (strain ATCC 64411 / 73-15) TaxID=644358 RepID=A0A0C4DV91_MAGP6|nr:hypothetical protein MAPG_03892 [Magnaporthiopsis poae ATCC 64411]
MNAPDRFELFLLADGEEKITETINTTMSNCSDFTFMKEDHTLGNLLCEHLKQQPNVLMAGYKVGHPNVPEFFLRIQTDGKVTPKVCLVEACRTIVQLLSQISGQFTREFELRRMVAAGEQQNGDQAGHGY